jgi:FkbM family methyltransferase
MLYKIIQLLPEIKGKHRLSRLILHNKISKKNDIISCKNGLLFLCPNFKENVSFELLINGIYEPRNIDFILKNIPKNGVFFDVGANIGAISIPIAKKRPDITIYCFEASQKVFSYLKKNIELNGLNNIKAMNCLLVDEVKGELPFYSPEEQYGKGSMSAIFTKNQEMVQTETLDNFVKEQDLQKVDFIKIDVEGYEKTVLSGSVSVLRNLKPKIFFEFLDWAEDASVVNQIGDAQRLLFQNDYRIFDFSNINIELKNPLLTGGADLIGIPKL